MVTTRLTSSIDSNDATITVTSTVGFPDVGVITIEGERIAYAHKTSTQFGGFPVINPLVRGAQGTTASSHSSGVNVRTVPSGLVNQALSYNVSVMADASGLWMVPTWMLAFVKAIGSFLILPLSFLPGDFSIILNLWLVIAIGFIFALVVQLAGGRRVG
jgi:hypothetical protein